jgi:hypothetical protein
LLLLLLLICLNSLFTICSRVDILFFLLNKTDILAVSSEMPNDNNMNKYKAKIGIWVWFGKFSPFQELSTREKGKSEIN